MSWRRRGRAAWTSLLRAARRTRRRPMALAISCVVAIVALTTTWQMLPDRWPRQMLVTAYCPCPICCGPLAAGITASGKPVTANGGKFVAADPDVPFGTMLVIPGYYAGRPVPVYDRGGAIRGNRIDVYFDSHAVAQRWGRRWLAVDRVADVVDQRPKSSSSYTRHVP